MAAALRVDAPCAGASAPSQPASESSRRHVISKFGGYVRDVPESRFQKPDIA
jgi:hypothetical protein